MPLWLLGIGGTLKNAASAAFGWISRYPWPCACLALLLACGWLWHGKAKAEQRIAAIEAVRQADAVTWTTADRLNHATIAKLIDTLNDQSRMIRAWGDAAKSKQNAAQAALKAATTRGERLEALAGAIDLEHAQSGASWPACRSGKAVMAAKGDL